MENEVLQSSMEDEVNSFGNSPSGSGAGNESAEQNQTPNQPTGRSALPSRAVQENSGSQVADRLSGLKIARFPWQQTGSRGFSRSAIPGVPGDATRRWLTAQSPPAPCARKLGKARAGELVYKHPA
jgi:hypothetical protein